MPSKNNVAALRAGQGATSILDQPSQSAAEKKPKREKAPVVQRVNKGFQVELERAQKWDLLVAQMKNKPGKEKRTGPQLMDEAMDYLFGKYLQ